MKICLLLFFLSPNLAYTQLWYQTRGIQGQDERAWGVATDKDGNIYWTVCQKDTWPFWYYNLVLYKFAPDGRQVWETPSWGGAFNDIAFVNGISGDRIYLAGRVDKNASPTSGDALLVCRNIADGGFNWEYTYDQGLGYEEIDGISVQPDGIYLTGWSDGGMTDMDFLVQKVSHEGHMVWTNTWDFDDLHKMDGANGHLAIDNQYVYAAGHVGRTNIASFDGDMGLACFSRSDGSLKWKTTWGGALYDDGLGLSMGADSMLYVVGMTGSYPGGSQLFLNKFNRTGELVWSRIWGGSKAEDSRIVVASRDSLILAVGSTSSYGNGDYDIFIIKYSSSGDLIDSLFWGGSSRETAHDAALYDDYLYVTGETWSYGKDALAGNDKSEALLLKLNISTMEGPDSVMTHVSLSAIPDKICNVFPNPSHDLIFVKREQYGDEPLMLEFIDANGIIKWQGEMPAHQDMVPISLAPLNITPGIYFVRLRNVKGLSAVRKILITSI